MNSQVQEVSEPQYYFKELDIEEILENAKKPRLTPERMSQLTASYTKNKKMLPELYYDFFKNYPLLRMTKRSGISK